MIPSEKENPVGLHRRYVVLHQNGEPIDTRAMYFVLRLDRFGKDAAHVEACRAAARAYADCVQSGDPRYMHLAPIGSDLRSLCDNEETEPSEEGQE